MLVGLDNVYRLAETNDHTYKVTLLAEGIGRSTSKRSNPWVFFALTYGVSWVLWMPVALLSRGTHTSPVTLLFYLGGTGPPLAGITLTYLTKEQEGRSDYWQRLIEFRRIGLGWYAVILLIVPVLTVLAILLDILAGGSGAQFYQVLLLSVAAIAITALWGPKSLTRQQENQDSARKTVLV